jgi:hypothetical protein
VAECLPPPVGGFLFVLANHCDYLYEVLLIQSADIASAAPSTDLSDSHSAEASVRGVLLRAIDVRIAPFSLASALSWCSDSNDVKCH